LTLPILITGATQRLGLAIAEDLLSQQIPVIVTYRTQKPAVEQLQRAGATVFQADFSTQDGIERAILEIKKLAPALRAIIHNASDWAAEVDSSSASDLFQRMMMIHASAPYQINLACKAALMQANTTTDIIHMTDLVQNTGSTNHTAYAASKAALHNLTLSFARLYAPNVKVNSIAPSLLMFNDNDSEAYRQKSLNKLLIDQLPGADEVVKAVNYLLQSEFMTGQTLHLNGGRNLK
jgi:dihydromonapterin reductase/dihydrofolate reductase